AAVLWVSPKQPLLAGEADALAQYVEAGGRLVMFADPRTAQPVRELAPRFGIEIGDDVVIDQVQRLFAGPEFGVQLFVNDYASHAVTEGFTPRHLTILNVASTVRATGTTAEGVTYTE